jgi:NAD(P)-dependent dehydrogenase (short-subunit alcohol dehydrogenase family)/acyl carrier protein
VEALRRAGHTPDAVVHLWAVDEPRVNNGDGRLEELLDRCFYSPLYIAQAFGATSANQAVQFFFISAGMQVVTGDEVIVPEKATLLGPCDAMAKEYARFSCHSVDVVPHELAGPRTTRLIDGLLAELILPSADRAVALRGGYRWTHGYGSLPIDAVDGVPDRLRPGGVYLITGGMGGIGMALANYLAKTVKAKLVLVGRSGVPAREQWDEWLATHADDDRISRRIRGIRGIESHGGEVMPAIADVTHREQMQDVVARARARFGRIHGVIHSAGVPAGGVIQLKTREEAARVLAPKVQGLRVLEETLGDGELDFMVLCSSLITVVGAAGQADYIAANAFLDAYAHQRSSRGQYTVAVNWDTWRDVGMAVETAVPEALAEQRSKRLQNGLSVEDGEEAFRRILQHDVPQVAVSPVRSAEQTSPLTIADTIAGASRADSAGHKPPRSRTRSRALTGAGVAPRDDVEKRIACIWEELFGIEGIGVTDGFFDLGGHSLLAIQIVSRINAEFHTELTLHAFFDAPTVARLAERIRDVGEDESAEAMVAKLSDEEVERMLIDRQIYNP